MKLQDVVRLQELQAGGPGSGRKPGFGQLATQNLQVYGYKRLGAPDSSGNTKWSHPEGHRVSLHDPDRASAVHRFAGDKPSWEHMAPGKAGGQYTRGDSAGSFGVHLAKVHVS